MTKVNVLCGGNSAERDVSLRSGEAVAAALTQAGYQVSTLNPANSTVEKMTDCDVVFPVLHGAGGEDGSLQAGFEARGARYVGSGPAASRLCFDKWDYRQIVEAHNMVMAPGTLVQADNYQVHALAQAPYVLKSLVGGSSIDIYIVRDPQTAPVAQIADTFYRYPTMLLEQLVDGVELTVGVLGETALPVIEIIPPEHGEFDYENKYNGTTQELCPPQHLPADIQQAAQTLAVQIHQLTDCRDLSRTDMIYSPDGRLVLLETNTMPGMTEQSLFPKAAAVAGLPMSELCDRLVQLALSR